MKKKVLELANHISLKKMGSKNGITEGDPEYRIMEPVVTEEMAEVALCMKRRVKATAKELAPLCNKSLERTRELLWELADAGVCFVNEIDGEDYYWFDTWVPGIMEMMVNHKENVKKYPQIAESFEAYGRVRGPKTAGAFPVGTGLMRVIPIEHAIDGETRRASYEEVSKYLMDNDVFSVSDCSCRTAREAMGEGCGHLKEDMCIQMGHAAKYYIRTKRGREITREEAFEIIDRAEKNGLMHQIPNLDGSGKTHAICNCCGCSCLSLRTAGMFKNTDMVRSNYVSQVDASKCTACGKCVQTCPVNALRLGQKLCAEEKKPEMETPRDTVWGQDKWNPNYRTNRENVEESGTSPCKTNCPAHIGIQGYIKLASQERYKEALKLIKEENPFPAVCGRICPRNCETDCTRSDVDEPVAIDEIKKFIAQKDLEDEHRFIPEKKGAYDIKIAVVGAGPAGLSCAYYLAVEGYSVTVFEKKEKPGGMLTYGIPAFRLEKDVVKEEIRILEELGVSFHFGVTVGKNVTLSRLRSDGYRAFYVAIGAQKGKISPLFQVEAKGVLSGIDFLEQSNQDVKMEFETDVVVIGGGNVAIDVARTALRKTKKTVHLVCLESIDTMPALKEEIDEALAEGVVIHNGWGAEALSIQNEELLGVDFIKCLSTLDASGKFAPVFDKEHTMHLDTSHVILSIGQSVDLGPLFDGTKVELNGDHTVKADPLTYQTKEDDIFVGGDLLTGPRFAIDAIAAGKQGAISIHRFVHPGQSLVIGRDTKIYRALDKENLNVSGYDTTMRQRPINKVEENGKQDDIDHRGIFTREQMLKETGRCLGCGATVVNSFMCVGCGACTLQCGFDAISLVRKYDGEGVALEDLKPVIVKNLIKRKGRIIIKNCKKAIKRK